MTVRTKLTFWYVGVLCTSIMVCTLLLYREWVLGPRRERELRHEARLREKEKEEKGQHETENQKEHPRRKG